MISRKRSAKGVKAFQLSHVESEAFYSLERTQIHMLPWLVLHLKV